MSLSKIGGLSLLISWFAEKIALMVSLEHLQEGRSVGEGERGVEGEGGREISRIFTFDYYLTFAPFHFLCVRLLTARGKPFDAQFCQGICDEDPTCFFWTFAPKKECSLSRLSIRFGSPTPEKEIDFSNPKTSGWRVDRIAKYYFDPKVRT